MEVKLLPINKEEVINKLYVACRTCYSAGTPQEQWEKVNEVSEEKKLKLIKYIMDSGHTSILEIPNLTFLISGIDRATSLQLVRHRIGCVYQQQSQRYCEFKEGKFDYVIPKSIEKDEYLKGIFEGTMQHLSDVYKKFIDNGIQPEDARAVLPNACCTNIVMTVNLRQLGHIMNERLCSNAQLPIRMLCKEIAKQTIDTLPFLETWLVPKCEMLGFCNESRRSCGRKLTKSEIFKEV